MTSDHDEKRFLQEVKQALDASADELDDLTRARLRAARQRALDAAAGGKNGSTLRWLLPAGGFAAATVATVVFLMLQAAPVEVVPPFSNGDMELLTSVDSLGLLENLEFYEWLEAETADAG